MIECVVNLSEGRDQAVIAAVVAAAGPALLDVHVDADHHRAVVTLGGEPEPVEAAARAVAEVAVTLLDLRAHHGAHPRLGVLDVVPWVHLEADPGGLLREASLGVATAARDRFATWAGTQLGLPCFCYGGADRPSLPALRRRAWNDLWPVTGPLRPHPTAGACCVGARPALVAYNLWLSRPDLELARQVAADLRSPELRTLGLQVGEAVQVSCNLVRPWSLGPAQAYDAVAARVGVDHAELVGLLPGAVLEAVSSSRWAELDLAADRTIEARLQSRR